MSRAESYIEEYARHCSNLLYRDCVGGFDKTAYQPWLTPDQARKAVEIAREEMIDWIDKHWREYINVDADGVVCFGHWKNDLRKAMKDE